MIYIFNLVKINCCYLFLLLLTPLAICFPQWANSGALFDLNFEGVAGADFLKGGYANSGQPFVCPDASNPDCNIGTFPDPDTTTFLHERIGGYWHLVIGDPSEGFVQETYTPIKNTFLSDSGGREPVFFTFSGNLEQWSGNGWDPLEFNNKTFGPDNVSFSGNGTGNPTKVIMRQVLGSGSLAATSDRVREWSCDAGQFCQEFLKSDFDFKPVITQQFDSDETTSFFKVDMSAIDYNTMGTTGIITNTLAITDPDMPDSDQVNPFGSNLITPDSSIFDMAVDSERSNTNAGRYTYTAGIGWYNDGDGDGFRAFDPGQYDYEDIGINADQMEMEWGVFFDPSQNSYGGNEIKCAVENLDPCNFPAINY